MKLSFKFKIALISFIVSGTLLTLFGIVFFVFAYHAGIDRMDREIRSLVQAQLHGGHPTEHWQDFNNSLEFIYGTEEAARIALRVSNADREILFESENAPPELAALPFPALPSMPPSPPGNHRRFPDRLDRDNDRRLSPQEFDGPPSDFRRADIDHDGYISTEESEQFDAPPRGGPRPLEASFPKEEPRFQTLKTQNGTWRIGQFTNPEIALYAAIDMNAFYADINRFRTAFFITVPVGLVLLGLAGWFLAARAMRPVAIIADTAEGITAKGLDQRIPMVGKDIELERLVRVSNGMLDRLEKSYNQAVRFSADAAHELQTPLTILQGELDNAIQSSENESGEQQR